MEEADALCSRLGIMVKGELRCDLSRLNHHETLNNFDLGVLELANT